jgi:acetoin:2,6-dichlorophenolindophenol oxidoreductase subunit beta
VIVREVTFLQAINEALREEMRKNPDIIIMGQDVGVAGGVRGVTKGLYEEFGEERVRDTPISEATTAGVGVGCAITGMRPVVEIMYSDFLGICMDEVMNKMAKWRYMHGSTMSVPMVLRTSCGGGFGGAAEHSQSLEALFMHIPGLRVAYPATPYDAKGLMKTLLRDDNPSLFFEHRLLYRTKGMIPDEEYYLPLDKAEIMREGTDVTVVAIGLQVGNALAAAQKLQEEGIKAEVIDLRMVAPLDKQTILTSVEKTGRLVVVEEGVKTGGVGAEIAAVVAEEGLFLLRAPVKRVASLDVPIPYSPPMEKYVLPNSEKVIAAVKTVMLD